MRREEQSPFADTVMTQVVVIRSTDEQVSVDLRQQPPVRPVFRDTRHDGSRRSQLRISSHQQRNAVSPARANRLNETLQIPARHKTGIETAIAEGRTDGWRVTSAVLVDARTRRNIFKPPKSIPFEQRNIPLELMAKARSRLTGRVLAVTVQDLELTLLRQCREPWCLILNRMTGNESEFHANGATASVTHRR